MCAVYAQGCIRLERVVQVKKLLFIRSVMIIDDREVLKIFSRIRADMFFADVQHVSSNPHVSPVFDMLNTQLHLVCMMKYSRWLHLDIIFPNNLGEL